MCACMCVRVCMCVCMFELACYQVRLDLLSLPCIALIRPSQLSCLGSLSG